MVNTGFSEITQDRLKYFGNDIWYLEVAITGKCNFNCNYCNRFSANLDLKSFYKVLKSNNKIHHIQVTGGEPTTHPAFFDIMNCCKEHCLTLGLSTNGSAHIHTYMRSQADRYSISFDDYLMDELIKRGYKNPINILLNIIQLIREGYYVDIGLVIDERNVDRIEEIIKYLLGLGVNDIKLSTSTKSGIIPKIVGDYSRHPILNYRVERIKQGLDNRGI